jgi:hypothetical protein
MSENNEKFVLEDGRKAEKIVTENKVSDKESQKIIEIRAEEVRPLKTSKRIIEKTRSYVYERVTETIDQETGRVIDSKVEEFDCNTGEAKEIEGRPVVLNEDTLTPCSLKRLKLKTPLVESCTEEKKNGPDLKNILLTVVIAAQVLALVYLLFLSK